MDGSTVWQADWEPFGSVAIGQGKLTSHIRFPGQYFDQETGLYYNYYRHYDPETGRYIESDPIGLLGGLNTYIYAVSDPYAAVDFLGLLEVYVWEPTKTTWGHASMRLDDGTYISWWPQRAGKSKCNCGYIFTSPAYQNRNYYQDKRDEGRPPDKAYRIRNLNEEKIREWWENWKKDLDWSSLSRNCSTTIAEGLKAGGADGGFWNNHNYPWTPEDIIDLVEGMK